MRQGDDGHCRVNVVKLNLEQNAFQRFIHIHLMKEFVLCQGQKSVSFLNVEPVFAPGSLIKMEPVIFVMEESWKIIFLPSFHSGIFRT